MNANDEIGYTAVYTSVHYYSQCLRCSAIVMNQTEHTTWHNNLDLAFVTIFQMLASPGDEIDLENILPKPIPVAPESRVNTQEENIAFRKQWDADYAEAQKRAAERKAQ